MKWYRKAADQGNARAQYNLGIKDDALTFVLQKSLDMLATLTLLSAVLL